MKQKQVEWDKIQQEHDLGKSLSKITEEFGISRTAINTAVRKKLFIKKYHTQIWSNESKQHQSFKRKEWLSKNPDKHPWKKNSKFQSVPCQHLKDILKSKGILFVEEYSPLSDRAFSIDISLPEKKIGIEINGEQHYTREGNLKPYYKNRHTLIENNGWKLIELHYSMVYCQDIIDNIINDLISGGVDIECDVNKYELLRLEKKQVADENRTLKRNFFCKECGKKLYGKTKTGYCLKCCAFNSRKVKRPERNELEKLINTTSLEQIGRIFNISGNSIKKWAKSMDIPLNNRKRFN